MTENSSNNLRSMSDLALLELIGAYVKHHRIEKNITQGRLSAMAGISRSTLGLLERGESVNLLTLIQVLRVLDILHVLSVFEKGVAFSPLALAKQQAEQRQRARSQDKRQSTKRNANKNNLDW